MELAASIGVGFVAVQHLGFLVLEMFLWKTPTGRKIFGTTKEVAEQSATLAANQGLYNGFLAAGLGWGLWLGDPSIQLFFLGCVVVAGVFGAATVSWRILVVQAVPAAATVALVLVASPAQ